MKGDFADFAHLGNQVLLQVRDALRVDFILVELRVDEHVIRRGVIGIGAVLLLQDHRFHLVLGLHHRFRNAVGHQVLHPQLDDGRVSAGFGGRPLDHNMWIFLNDNNVARLKFAGGHDTHFRVPILTFKGSAQTSVNCGLNRPFGQVRLPRLCHGAR